MPRAYEDGDLLHVSARSRNHIPRSRGVIGHLISDPQVVVHNLPLGDPSDHLGVQLGKVPVSDPVATFLGLAGVMHWKDLVAIGDYLVRIPVRQAGPLPARPFVTLPDLRSRVASFRGRGKCRAAHSIALVREGADSRPETLLRLLIREAGLPTPELNMNVFDQHGRWIARVDMFYPEFGLIVEYDGDQHRTSTRQYERDAQRIEQLTAINCNVLRVRARGLWQDHAETAERIRKALLAAGWNRER